MNKRVEMAITFLKMLKANDKLNDDDYMFLKSLIEDIQREIDKINERNKDKEYIEENL